MAIYRNTMECITAFAKWNSAGAGAGAASPLDAMISRAAGGGFGKKRSSGIMLGTFAAQLGILMRITRRVSRCVA
ncbi:MAG: hypothetical protein R3C56_07270 [Pirellulaceae bacterium]